MVVGVAIQILEPERRFERRAEWSPCSIGLLGLLGAFPVQSRRIAQQEKQEFEVEAVVVAVVVADNFVDSMVVAVVVGNFADCNQNHNHYYFLLHKSSHLVVVVVALEAFLVVDNIVAESATFDEK